MKKLDVSMGLSFPLYNFLCSVILYLYGLIKLSTSCKALTLLRAGSLFQLFRVRILQCPIQVTFTLPLPTNNSSTCIIRGSVRDDRVDPNTSLHMYTSINQFLTMTNIGERLKTTNINQTLTITNIEQCLLTTNTINDQTRFRTDNYDHRSHD